jgi:DNA-directed RNA polymerase subunit RPC12/RpoP
VTRHGVVLPIPDEGLSGYLCHACGRQLFFWHGSRMLRCFHCRAKRRIPTHPALIMANPPLGYHWPEK